ncbi:hypothetical protein OSB04_023204 [Centaurea solstitialis]|uniref:DUF659 domain-containing protein n=1 Tax=Centaurea solstitialis TaxID=347529 RepID=A0AA38W223_9ASTR|nr:hypothetical protein OSB04_023204 [Centaurea solstitialis]
MTKNTLELTDLFNRNGGDAMNAFPTSGGVRGPMDRYMEKIHDGITDDQIETPTSAKEHRNQVWENGNPLNCARSPFYFNMLRLVGNYGIGLKAPTIAFEIIDASDCVKDAKKLFKLLDDVIEEVGEDIVVQVVTDTASAYKAAGTLLMKKRKHLYWTPCAAHCIDLILEKIGELPQQKSALLKEKKNRKERPSTRCHTICHRLSNSRSMFEMKEALQIMFVSREWNGCAWAKKEDGKAVKQIIMDERTFWLSMAYSIKTTKPLVHVLRIVDCEAPTLGFIYGAMDKAKEKIALNFGGDVSSYKKIWDIIDDKWDRQLHCDLDATAYYLNPDIDGVPMFRNIWRSNKGCIGAWIDSLGMTPHNQRLIANLKCSNTKRNVWI